MTKNSNKYLEIEQKDSSSKIMIMGENVPLLIDAIADYVEKFGGKAITKYNSKQEVDYLLVFNDTTRLKKYLKLVKPNGKVLHVISEKPKESSYPVSTYILSPTKTYKTDILVRKLLTKLYESKSYASSKKQKTKKKPISKQKPKRKSNIRKYMKWTAFTAILIFLLLATPLIIWSGSIGVSLYNLTFLTNPELDSEQQLIKIQHATVSANTAEQIHNFLSPVIQSVSPEIASIVSDHMTIFASVVTTSEIVIEQQESVQSFFSSISDGTANQIEYETPQAKQALLVTQASLEPAVSAISDLSQYKDHTLVAPIWDYYEEIEQIDQSIEHASLFIDSVPDLFAVKTRKKYLVLFQNNFELRPTGGFIGSYALVTMENGSLKDIQVEDVYEADGQLKGHVEPPEPISTYLDQPSWFLRDSNWNPDFALSARQAEWFIEKEIGEQVDGVIAIDLYVLKNMLNSLDGVYVPDYNATVYADDFFYKLQNDNHDNFFPGSNKKKNLISSLTNALMLEISNQDTVSLVKLAQTLESSLNEKHIMIYSHDRKVQETIEQLGWGGRIVSHQNVLEDQSDTVADYVMVVDANVGVNKVNSNIDREFYTTIDTVDNKIVRELVVYYKNRSDPNSDSLYDGLYKNYARIFIPKQANISSVTINNKPVDLTKSATIESYGDKKSIGLLVEVPPLSDIRVVVYYSLPLPETDLYTYQLMAQKQPGTDKDPFIVRLGKNAQENLIVSDIPKFPYMTNLDKDQLISVDFKR